MTISKFGSHISKKHKYKKQFLHFNLLKSRHHINADNLRIINVALPVSSTDAVNKHYTDSLGRFFMDLKNWPGNFINGNRKRLANFSPPIDAYDVVTKGFFLDNAITLSRDIYDGHNKRISNVAAPISDTDLVTLGYLKTVLELRDAT